MPWTNHRLTSPISSAASAAGSTRSRPFTSATSTSARSKPPTITTRSGAVLTRETHRIAAAIDVALSRAAADRRRADGRHAGRLHAAGESGPAREGARHSRALRQERHGQLPDACPSKIASSPSR